MSTSENVVDSTRLPSFELEYGLDDPEAPTAVTVFAPDAADVSTAWLSIDADHAVPLEDVA